MQHQTPIPKNSCSKGFYLINKYIFYRHIKKQFSVLLTWFHRAIEESLMMARMKGIPSWTPNGAEGFSGSSRSQVEFNIPPNPDDSAAEGAAALGRTASFDELQAALDLSRRQIEEEERLRLEEEEALKRVLELSLVDK